MRARLAGFDPVHFAALTFPASSLVRSVMPLVSTDYYSLPEALELIEERIPNEDPLDNLLDALKDFKKASTIDTNNPEIYNFIGLIAAQLGQNDGAANYLNIAIGLNSNNCSAINNLAVLYALQSKFDEANKLFKNAKTNCPDSKEIDLNLKQIGKN